MWSGLIEGIATVAALWGAFLSTWLWIEKLLQARPVFILESDPLYSSGDYWIAIRIINPGPYPIMVRRVSVRKPRAEKAGIRSVTADGMDLRHVIRYVMTDEMNFSIPSGKEGRISLVLVDKDVGLDLSIFWYRQRPVIRKTWATRLRRSKAELDHLVHTAQPADTL